MTIRPILLYPDLLLRVIAAPVTRFDADLQMLAGDLLETMRAAPGIGITACHIGIAQRVVVLDLPDQRPGAVYVNPLIVWSSPETAKHEEGSISMPGVSDLVERPARVTVSFQDLSGTAHQVTADGLLAVCLQHEIDQLDGVFWLQRLSRLKRDRLIRRYEKLSRPT